jgi:hypothetical protein
MSLALIPLDEGRLSPAVRRVASPSSPAALRLSVARGMAPLGPADLVVALYQIAATSDEELQAAARKTASELPDPVLTAALGGTREPRVLDFFAHALVARPKLIQLLLLNLSAADATVEHLASVCADAELELIAQNEQRLLRHPPIITALYLNPKTRMSTATRAVELAVRNGVRLDGIAVFDDLRAAIESEGGAATIDASFDEAFTTVLGIAVRPPAAPAPVPDEEQQEAIADEADQKAERALSGQSQDDKAALIGRLPIVAKMRLAIVGSTPEVDLRGAAFARAVLVRDSNKMVALAAIRNPSVTEHEAELYAGNRGLCEEVIRFISGNRMFVRRYTVKLNLVNNPKCPLQAALGFLPHLQPKDLKALSRSKGVPSALARAAKGLIEKRDR